MYAEVGDVEDYHGPIADADVARVERLIAQAEAQVAQRVPDLTDRITAGRTSVVLVTQVIAEMVVAVLRNPDGVRQRSETVGPYTRSMTLGSSQTAGVVDADLGVLSLTRRQRRLLGDRMGGVTVPAADPALSRPLVRQWADDGRFRSDNGGYLWPPV